MRDAHHAKTYIFHLIERRAMTGHRNSAGAAAAPQASGVDIFAPQRLPPSIERHEPYSIPKYDTTTAPPGHAMSRCRAYSKMTMQKFR